MICGIDEAGRGPVIGPLVVAAVWVDKNDEQRMVEIGVKDSKKLSPNRRKNISVEIIKNWEYEIIAISAHDIDLLRKTMTINDLEAYLFASLAKKRRAAIYYIDAASANETAFALSVKKNLMWNVNIICEHGADDRYPVVAAASIVAKVERDKQVKNIANELENRLGLPLGSGYPSDKKTTQFIKTWYETYGALPPHTRKSWKTVEYILAEVNQNTLF